MICRKRQPKQYPQRTEKNVQDSDATVVFTIAPKLKGGSNKPVKLAHKYSKPVLHLHRGLPKVEERLVAFVMEHNVSVLNVAGSRASNEPGVASFVKSTRSCILPVVASVDGGQKRRPRRKISPGCTEMGNATPSLRDSGRREHGGGTKWREAEACRRLDVCFASRGYDTQMSCYRTTRLVQWLKH